VGEWESGRVGEWEKRKKTKDKSTKIKVEEVEVLKRMTARL
jgi:hypothetical protein